MNVNDLTGLGAVADLARTTIAAIWPDKSDQERAQLAAAVQLVQGQLAVNQVEAASPSVFVAGWRPFVGWACGAAMAAEFILRPMLQWSFAVAGYPIPEFPTIDGKLWELLFGMLGIGTLRTVEKLNGKA